MTGNGLKWTGMAENGREWQDMAEDGCGWPEKAGNGWEWLGMTWDGWKYNILDSVIFCAPHLDISIKVTIISDCQVT